MLKINNNKIYLWKWKFSYYNNISHTYSFMCTMAQTESVYMRNKKRIVYTTLKAIFIIIFHTYSPIAIPYTKINIIIYMLSTTLYIDRV